MRPIVQPLIALFLLLLFTVQHANAQGCGCDKTIAPGVDGGAYLNGTSLGVVPGDTVCFTAAYYKYINLRNFNGTAANPITFINCGNVVTVGETNYGLVINDCSYFRFTGTGVAGQKYGFRFVGAPTMNIGVGIAGKSTDFEMDHVEIAKSGVGVICKTNPSCDPQTWEAAWTMRNISFHDMYLHAIDGEGYYVGHTSINVSVSNCNGQTISVKPQKIRGLKIYNNITDSTGWDGIQASLAPENVEIYNNTVKNFGIRNTGNQQAGIILGGLCNGKVYNNKVSNGSGTGIVVFGYNNCRVYNNIVSDVGSDGSAQGQDGIFIDDRPDPTYPGLQVFVMNNTIVRPKRHGIRLMNSNGTVISGNLIQNNLIVEPGIYASAPASAFVGISSNTSATASFNLGYPNIATAQFINPASDFRIAATSPAKDAGTNLTSTGILNDIIGTSRPNGTNYDVGAYEYFVPNQPNQAPNANAGADITITLPTNTVNLNGSLTNDPDGNITTYAWSKLSGPAQGTIVSPSSVTTTVSNLAAGVYQFVLTVTDAGSLTDKDTVQVTVNAAPNQAPNANAGADITIVLPTNTGTLNGSLSNDPDGNITTYAWSKLSGPAQGTIASPTLASTAVNNLAAGVYQFVLTVTDNGGLTDKDTMQLIVNQPTGVNNVNQDKKSLQVFPNPVTDNCSIRLAKFETGEVVLRITDAWGRYIWEKVVMFSGRELILNESLGFLEKGTYTIICSDKNSRTVSQKIVKL